MRQSNAVCFTRSLGSAIVLLARIIDSAGRPLRPSDIAAIEYSVHEHGNVGCSLREQLAFRGAKGLHSAAPLAACDVISSALVADDLWTVDELGYNFRHQVAIGQHVGTPRFSGFLEVRYVFTQTDDARSIVRFHLKLI